MGLDSSCVRIEEIRDHARYNRKGKAESDESSFLLAKQRMQVGDEVVSVYQMLYGILSCEIE